MTNHPNRAARFHLLRPISMDTRSLETTYEIVSRHRTLEAAVAAGEHRHQIESRERMPHRQPTLTSQYVVRDTRTGAETIV